jgi:hypothetical protein
MKYQSAPIHVVTKEAIDLFDAQVASFKVLNKEESQEGSDNGTSG